MSLSLETSTELCSLLADSRRLRLLLLLEAHELSVAELTEITGLAQSRVSTHLSRLKRAGLVQDKRAGASALYSASGNGGAANEIWELLRGRLDDAQTRLDREHAEEVIRARKHGQTWSTTNSCRRSWTRHEAAPVAQALSSSPASSPSPWPTSPANACTSSP